jgi:hypothetical protein
MQLGEAAGCELYLIPPSSCGFSPGELLQFAEVGAGGGSLDEQDCSGGDDGPAGGAGALQEVAVARWRTGQGCSHCRKLVPIGPAGLLGMGCLFYMQPEVYYCLDMMHAAMSVCAAFGCTACGECTAWAAQAMWHCNDHTASLFTVKCQRGR